MPIAEFKCSSCNYIRGYYLKQSDPKPQKCLHCNKDKVLIQIESKLSFRIADAGWHISDVKSDFTKLRSPSTSILG
ncbi:MAG: zinc ribbon domain-containing protein [Oligoflexales bacterium]